MVAPIPGAVVTCEFGIKGGWAAGYHTGRDYRARSPLRVGASAAGTVVHAGWGGWGAPYGLHVVVQTGGVRHMYAHLSAVSVRVGQTVAAGQQVGRSGATGTRVFGPHLHYEERVSPFRYANHRRPQLDLQRDGETPVRSGKTPPKVDIAKVVKAFRLDPPRPQGDGTHPREIRIVERALAAQGLLSRRYGADGYAGDLTRSAYRAWQQVLGFTGADADGIPGRTSLSALGDLHGFTVVGKVPKGPPLVVPDREDATVALPTGPVAVDWCPFATRDIIPGSSTAPWSAKRHPRWKGMLHTTEGSSYAGARASYLDGGVPHFTVEPDFDRRRVRYFQHYPLSSRATALRDPDGTAIKENRVHVVQIEVVGTCDESNRAAWREGLFVEDWPHWYLRGIRRLMRWIEASRPVPHGSDVVWKPYDAGRASGSYGARNGVRMSAAKFDVYAGWLGHQHASGNTHGDPGRVNIDYLLKR